MTHNSRSMAYLVTAISFVAAALTFGATGARAQGDGPRAYFYVPKETRLISVYGLFLRGNQSLDPGVVVKGGNLDVNVAALQYTHPFVAGGKMGAAIAVLPFGEAKGSLKLPNRELKSTSSGLGDLQLGVGITLAGPPPLSLPEYVAYKPGYSVGVLAKLFIPTGAYSSSKVVNLGANRWALQIGAPACYYLGKSFLDPQLMTFELLPSVTFYTKNNAAFRYTVSAPTLGDITVGGGSSQQDPLFRLEGHITRNVHPAVWLSLDGLYTHGGRTKNADRTTNDTQNSFGLGGTVSLAISKQASGKLTYGGIVSHNDSGADGHFWRIVGNYAF